MDYKKEYFAPTTLDGAPAIIVSKAALDHYIDEFCQLRDKSRRAHDDEYYYVNDGKVDILLDLLHFIEKND